MTKFPAIIFIQVLIACSSKTVVQTVDTSHENHGVRDRIFGVVEDLFISLKNNQTMIKPNTVEEYMAMQNFMQDVIRKNDEKYKQLRNNIEITISNETADKLSGVNEVIVELISEPSTQNESFFSNSNVSVKLQDLEDLTNIGIEKNEAETLNQNNLKFGSNTSQGVGGRRIFAGSSTGIQRYPFIVSVHVAGQFVCAGSLLHESLAITAASCVMRTQDDRRIKVQMRVGSDFVSKKGYLVSVDRLFFHPEFDRSMLANNLAILKSQTPLQFRKRKVVAIKYDKWDIKLSSLRDAKEIVILGWGRRDPSEKSETEVRPLTRARLNVYDLEECKYIYTKEYVTKKNFCGGFVDRGEGACNHDGGGPALVGSLLSGVISFGSPHCGLMDAPTVFTRLGYYSDWIERVMEDATVPHHFNIPGSIELGVTSKELDKVDLELGHPKDVLFKEFGLQNIINGPIDKPRNRTFMKSHNNRLPEDHVNKKKMLHSTNISAEVHSSIVQIKFSDSEENKQPNDVGEVSSEELILPENNINKDAHDKIGTTHKVIENKMVTNTNGIKNTEIMADTATIQASESSDENITPNYPVATSKTQIMKIKKWDFANHDVSKQNSSEVFEIQYEVDIKPVALKKINKPNIRQNKSIIILTSNGRSQRFNIKNANLSMDKLRRGIYKLLENL